MLRKWEYRYSKEDKIITSTESKSSSSIETAEANGYHIKRIKQTKEIQRNTSTVKIFNIIFQAEAKTYSMLDPGDKVLLDSRLDALFTIYFDALRMGTLASLEPMDQAIIRMAEANIVDPLIHGNSRQICNPHFWNKSYSSTITTSETNQSIQSETISKEITHAIMRR